ncbi:MAG: protein-disulfide reductase DsbD domain-containing protein [Pseudolabrys sp.]
MERGPNFLAFVAVGAMLATGGASTRALAADASSWAQDLHSAVRLIAGSGTTDAGQLRAGVEIKMKPGWKTYWRYPGDAGVPPRFDFSGSTNLATAKVLWPAPHVFTDESGKSIGYKDGILFPLSVTPRQQGKPVTVKLKIDYGVCEKLCVPAQGEVSITLDGKTRANDALLNAAEAKVPRQVAAEAAGLKARRVSGKQKPLVLIDLPAPAKGKSLEVIVEGPTLEWALPVPSAAPGAPEGRRHFGFELDGVPPGVDPNGPFALTFTIVGGETPLEVTTRLD